MDKLEKERIYSNVLAEIRAEASKSSVSTYHDLYKIVVDALSNIPYFNWTGIYLLNSDSKELDLEYYVGKPTEHTNIKVGMGVCGSAVAENTDKIVDDVTEEDNYLACSIETRSEIVVLIRDDNDKIIGQIDVDSDTPKAFDEIDRTKLQEIAVIIKQKLKEL